MHDLTQEEYTRLRHKFKAICKAYGFPSQIHRDILHDYLLKQLQKPDVKIIPKYFMIDWIRLTLGRKGQKRNLYNASSFHIDKYF